MNMIEKIESIPAGWKVVYNKGSKITVFQYEECKTYVTAVDLSTGAKVVPYYELASGNVNATQANPSPSFNKKLVSDFNLSLEGRFSIINLSFFGNVDQSAFIVRKNSTLISAGYATFSSVDISSEAPAVESVDISSEAYTNTSEGPRRTLTITYPCAAVYEGPGESEGNYYDLASQLYTDSTHALTGLHPLDADKGKDSLVPRTFVGIKPKTSAVDSAACVYTLMSESLTQQQAYDMLISFGCSGNDIVMFDGGGSTQMNIEDSVIIPSSVDRPVPVFLVVKE